MPILLHIKYTQGKKKQCLFLCVSSKWVDYVGSFWVETEICLAVRIVSYFSRHRNKTSWQDLPKHDRTFSWNQTLETVFLCSCFNWWILDYLTLMFSSTLYLTSLILQDLRILLMAGHKTITFRYKRQGTKTEKAARQGHTVGCAWGQSNSTFER